MPKYASSPEDFPLTFKSNFDSGDVEALVFGYSDDAVLDLGGGQRAYGREAIRSVLQSFLAPGLPIEVMPRRTTTTGSLSIVTFDWSIIGRAADGSAIEMTGSAIDILRQEGDVWLQLIDLPFGSNTPDA